MADESEEKTEQPTKRKLDEAREKGQLPQIKDIVTVTLTLTVAGYLWFAAGLVMGQFGELIEIVGRVSAEPFDAALGRGLRAAVEIGTLIVVPVLVIIIGTVIVTTIIANKGVVFAPEQIKPKGERINPASGSGRIFSLQTLLETIKSSIKITVIFVIAWVVLRVTLADLLIAPRCGADCVLGVTRWIFLLFLAAVAILFLVFAFFDYFMQQWLYRRQLRMTKTEVKRQHKDQEGDPHIKGHRRALARELFGQGPEDPVPLTTVVISDGMEMVAGLRYVADETPVPMLIVLATGAAADRYLEQTAERGIPRIERAHLAQALAEQGVPGEPIPADLFDEIAKAIAAVAPFSSGI